MHGRSHARAYLVWCFMDSDAIVQARTAGITGGRFPPALFVASPTCRLAQCSAARAHGPRTVNFCRHQKVCEILQIADLSASCKRGVGARPAGARAVWGRDQPDISEENFVIHRGQPRVR